MAETPPPIIEEILSRLKELEDLVIELELRLRLLDDD